jgi:hypothetical protein
MGSQKKISQEINLIASSMHWQPVTF